MYIQTMHYCFNIERVPNETETQFRNTVLKVTETLDKYPHKIKDLPAVIEECRIFVAYHLIHATSDYTFTHLDIS